MNARLKQIESHGVDRTKYPFASFCFGRGWKGHKTSDNAIRAARRDARRAVAEYGGGEPQNLVVETVHGSQIAY